MHTGLNTENADVLEFRKSRRGYEKYYCNGHRLQGEFF